MKKSLKKWRKVWRQRGKKKKHPTILAINLQPGDRIVLPDGKSEGRVQYVECNEAVFTVSKAKQSVACITYLKWNALEKKKVPNQKLFVPWNDEIQVVREPKAKWSAVHGWLTHWAKKLEVKRDW